MNFKPPSGGKFLKPRSGRKQDANSTITGSETNRTKLSSRYGSTSSLNQTVVRNLDSTVSVFEHRVKPNTNDTELEYDLAYGGYLQALMKQEIMKNTIERHETTMNDQVIVYSEKLHRLKSDYDDILNKIADLKSREEVAEQIDALTRTTDDLKTVCDVTSVENRLEEACKVFRVRLGIVRTGNIKPITNQDEYDKLIGVLRDFESVAQKFVKAERNFQETNSLAQEIRSCSRLRDEVRKLSHEVEELRREATSIFVHKASDMFAREAGYF